MRAGRRPWITLMLREFVTHEIAVACCQCFVICRTPAKRSRRNRPKSHEAIPRSLGSTDHRQPVQSGSSSTKKNIKCWIPTKPPFLFQRSAEKRARCGQETSEFLPVLVHFAPTRRLRAKGWMKFNEPSLAGLNLASRKDEDQDLSASL